MSSFLTYRNHFRKELEGRNIDEEYVEKFVVTSLYFSQLAYFSHTHMHQKLMDLQPIHFSIYSRNNAQAIFAEFDTFAVVSFRGSERTHWQELRTDLRCWKTNFNGFAVHSGFLELLDAVKSRLMLDLDDLDPGKKLLFTGHSLGGALSCLLALEHKPTDICVFGAPRIGGTEVCKYFDDVNVVSIAAENDFVPELPPKFVGYNDIRDSKKCPGKKGKWESHKLRTYLRAILRDEKLQDTP